MYFFWGSVSKWANVLASKRNGAFKKGSSKKCRREPKGRNSRDVRKRRHWDDARAGSRTRNTQEIQGNKRGQRAKQTRQMKEKHCLTPKTFCSVTKSGREKRGAEVSLGAGHCYMCARAAQSSANIDNMRPSSK